MAKRKEKIYWAGFCDDQLAITLEAQFGYDTNAKMPSIYKTKKEAQKRFQDVRKVKIVEVKNGK